MTHNKNGKGSYVNVIQQKKCVLRKDIFWDCKSVKCLEDKICFDA